AALTERQRSKKKVKRNKKKNRIWCIDFGRYGVCSEPTRKSGLWGTRHDRRCASLRLGYVGVGGCTARSVCATLAEDGGAAGQGPVVGLSGQAGLDGIVLDVGADGVELFGRADPMVEGLVLPEMFLLQGED